MKPCRVQLRISRIVIDSPAAHGLPHLSREFGRALPEAIKARLTCGVAAPAMAATTNLCEPIADAVAARLQPYLQER